MERKKLACLIIKELKDNNIENFLKLLIITLIQTELLINK